MDKFLNRRADQPYSANDYAVAWGLVYLLATKKVDPKGQSWIGACLDAPKRVPEMDATAASAGMPAARLRF